MFSKSYALTYRVFPDKDGRPVFREVYFTSRHRRISEAELQECWHSVVTAEEWIEDAVLVHHIVVY